MPPCIGSRKQTVALAAPVCGLSRSVAIVLILWGVALLPGGRVAAEELHAPGASEG